MYLSEPYPGLTGVFPNYDPTQLNNQGVGTVLRGDEARRERYNNYNVTLRRQLPANFSATVAYIGAYGTRLPFMPLDLGNGNEINRMPFDALVAVWRPAVQQPVESAAARHSAAVSRFHRHRAAGAAAVSAVHEHPVSEQLQGQDPLQLVADDARASLQQGLRGGRRLHVVQDRRQLPQAGCVRRGVGTRDRRPALPALPQADVDLRAANRSRQEQWT